VLRYDAILFSTTIKENFSAPI